MRLVGENRAQDLQEKVAAHGELFEWDFIGQLQSRRVRLIVPHVAPDPLASPPSPRCASSSATASSRAPACAILSRSTSRGEAGKAGIAPERARRVHRALAGPGRRADDDAAALAGPRGRAAAGSPRCASWRTSAACEHLSMGTSQDYLVAVEEGATIVRIGTNLYNRQVPAPLGGPSAGPANY